MSGTRRSSGIQYIQEEIPSLDAPRYEGDRYEALVPDTLDLQERAALAVNGLTGPTDPEADHEIYWQVYMHGDRPVMHHDHNDHVQIKFHEALPLMRIASGSDLNEGVDQCWMEVVQHMRGPNGLLYYPIVGRPWVRIHLIEEQFGPLPDERHFAQPYNNGRTLAAVTLYYLLTGDDLWLETGRGMVDGLWKLATDRGDYAYYIKPQVAPGEVGDPNAPLPGHWRSTVNGWVGMGLAQFFRFTGYEPAGELAGKLARHLRYHSGNFDAEASYLPEHPEDADIAERAHLHGHAYQLLGILEWALAVGDDDMVEYVRKGYEYGRRYGEPLTGFFPEWIDPRYRKGSELCGPADMIALGVKLSAAGAGDYWDDVDRWTRNMFAEGQLIRADWMHRVGAGEPHFPIDEMYQTDDRVGERNIGAFAGWPSANDFFGARYNLGHNNIFMHCCTGNATRTIYYVWEHILNYDHGRLKVNLLMNRASPWADVDSHIPYEGQVDVKIKQPCDLSIRIPEWVTPGEVTCQANDQARRVDWDGRCARVGDVRPGDIVTLSFPVAERTDTVVIEKDAYRLVRKGNEVVVIDPPGRYAPLYQRDHYRENSTRWRGISRFVPEQVVDW